MRRAITNAILFLMVAVIMTAFSVSAFTSTPGSTEFGEHDVEDFESENKCRMCHALAYTQWEGTMHYYAYVDPFYQAKANVASHETDGMLDEFCARCHTPIGVVSGEIPPADGSEMSDISKKGVHCDFCHVISGSTGVGNAPFVVTPGKMKWGPIEESRPAQHDAEYMELYTQAEYCGMCHLVVHPENGLVVDDTYTVWKNSQYAKDNITCQDCHMTEGITEFKANPGRAASTSPRRDHISTHAIVGANAFIPKILGEDRIAKMAVDRLQNAATMELVVPQTAGAGEEINIDVSITNTGAGHNLPTGVSEIREMWIETVVTDKEGIVIYSAGTLDTSRSIDSAKVIYNTVLGDSEGNPTENFWMADRILEDKRIGPKKTVTEQHTFVVPEDAAHPLKVDTWLNYRSASQELIDYLFDAGTYEVPVVRMNHASSTVYHPDTPLEERTESTPGFVGIVTAIAFIIAMYMLNGNKRRNQ